MERVPPPLGNGFRGNLSKHYFILLSVRANLIFSWCLSHVHKTNSFHAVQSAVSLGPEICTELFAGSGSVCFYKPIVFLGKWSFYLFVPIYNSCFQLKFLPFNLLILWLFEKAEHIPLWGRTHGLQGRPPSTASLTQAHFTSGRKPFLRGQG